MRDSNIPFPDFERTPENAARYVGFTESYATLLAYRRGHYPIVRRAPPYIINQEDREAAGITPAPNHLKELVWWVENGIVVESNFGLYYIR